MYDVTVTSKGKLLFSDLDLRKVGKVDCGVANYIVGSGIDSAKDGCEKTASFVQPTGICAEGETIFLTDTGAAAVKIISPTEPLAAFLKHNSTLYTSHEIHSNQHPNLPEAVSVMEEAVSYFEKAVTALFLLSHEMTEIFFNTSKDDNSTVRPHDDNIECFNSNLNGS